jgi:hypothetical protein
VVEVSAIGYLRAKYQAATPGPWTIDVDRTFEGRPCIVAPEPVIPGDFRFVASHLNGADALLIVGVYANLPALLNMAEAATDLHYAMGTLVPKVGVVRKSWEKPLPVASNGLRALDRLGSALERLGAP